MKKKVIFAALALLALLSVSCKKETGYLPEMQVVDPDLRWNVKTDYSVLSPYVSRSSMYSRLNNEAMTELMPNNDYGMLLPYAGSYVVTEYNRIQIQKYGLVSVKGVAVTDPVYDSVNMGELYIGSPKRFPVYLLGMDQPNSENSYYTIRLHAVCALDGSWVTPLEYMNVSFSETVMTMVRDYGNYDIDVFDLKGNLLYNVSEFGWVKDLGPYSAYSISSSCDTEGYVVVEMKDGTSGYLHLPTGILKKTEFYHGSQFANGLAAVAIPDSRSLTEKYLWGYINTEFELVIDCQYDWANSFINGYALVREMSEASEVQQLINTHGDVLMSVKDATITILDDGKGFMVVEHLNWEPKYYSIDLAEINAYSKYGIVNDVYQMGNGWFVGDCYENAPFEQAHSDRQMGAFLGKLLFNENAEYLYPGISAISAVVGDYVVYSKVLKSLTGSQADGFPYYQQVWGMGVMTLEGKDLIPAKEEVFIEIAVYADSIYTFIQNETPSGSFFAPMSSFDSCYRLIDAYGNVLSSGEGRMAYNEEAQLYSVISQDTHKYLDISGKTVISIPLMSYMLD